MDEREILTRPAPQADERIVYGEGPHRFGDFRVPMGRGPHPVAVVIHGGFWRAAFSLEPVGHLCEALRQAGVATWSLEYRRIGQEGGGWPGTGEDVLAGIAHLTKLAGGANLDLQRVVAVGHSAGGQLAAWAAAERPRVFRGVVPLGGVLDLRRAWELKLSNTVVGELMGGGPAELAESYQRASPAERAPLGVPSRVIHGTADEIVPIEIAERFVEKAGAEAKLIRLEGAGHFAVIDPLTAEFALVRAAVLELLG